MARITPAAELPTLWTVPDDLWRGFIVPILKKHDPEPPTGRPRIDQRRAFDGILFILRSGCQWNRLPREFGNDSSVHRTFQRWVRLGIFQKLWTALVSYGRRLAWSSSTGSRPTAPWARRASGGSSRQEPHGSGQTGHEAQRADRRRWLPDGGAYRRRQRP